jgi:hypothetical protein
VISETDIEIAHRWQNFRIRCLELAIASGAKKQDAIEVADKLGLYILRKSEVEINTKNDNQSDKSQRNTQSNQ